MKNDMACFKYIKQFFQLLKNIQCQERQTHKIWPICGYCSSSLNMFLWRSKDLQGLIIEWKSSCHAVRQHRPWPSLHFWSHAHQLLLWFCHQWQWLPGWIYGHSWVLCNKWYSILQCYVWRNIIFSIVSFDIRCVQGHTVWTFMNLNTGMSVALAMTRLWVWAVYRRQECHSLPLSTKMWNDWIERTQHFLNK